ncbi:thioesterase family protein [uncultured Psychrosphaera sp.]|uniref:acyl-CoA thioesterase n=1 Tax=uncultured Psychrosphaera sp. TaxID=1403522 RepID=UPI00261ADC70|nr:thioesterase family protein [uncultured Psychrosphaera sp.]
MSHSSQIKVRGFHLDIYQHVNNARYLEFLEEARWEYLEDTGDLEYFQSLGLAWVIVNININYRASATMGQTLDVTTALSKVSGKSAVFNQVITLAGTDTIVADADITFVLLNQKTGKPVKIEGEVLERMEGHLKAVGEEL